MKEKKTYTRFTCDQCGKESRQIEEGKEAFPYDSNWEYLHRISVKSYSGRQVREDKHFCCKACLKEFVMEVLDI